ncbi:MAG: hypothetical protein AAF843_12785 [Bacteroidota bacterium]
MKRLLFTHILPLLLIIGFTAFFIPWEKHPYFLLDTAEQLRQEVSIYTHKHTKRTAKRIANRWEYLTDYEGYADRVPFFEKNYISFRLPPDLPDDTLPDTLYIRFNTNEVDIVSCCDVDSSQFSWNVGYVEYFTDGHWHQMHETIGENDTLVIPLTVPDACFPCLDESIFLSILPVAWRKSPQGVAAKIL